VDHRDGDPGNNEMTNLQPLCHSCHSIKTARDHGKRVYQGCGVDGMPLDPSHPWNQKSPATEAARPRPQSSFIADCLKNRQP